MRRLTRRVALVAAASLAAAGCKPRDNIRTEPVEEQVNLKPVVAMADAEAERQLISGFHSVEQGSWRWTAGRFAVILPTPAAPANATLAIHLNVPEALLRQTGPVTLTAASKGTVIGRETWRTAGEYTFETPIPEPLLRAPTLTVDFSLDKFLPAGSAETRELGLIVSSVVLEAPGKSYK